MKEYKHDGNIYHVWEDPAEAWDKSELPEYDGWLICCCGNYENALFRPMTEEELKSC